MAGVSICVKIRISGAVVWHAVDFITRATLGHGLSSVV